MAQMQISNSEFSSGFGRTTYISNLKINIQGFIFLKSTNTAPSVGLFESGIRHARPSVEWVGWMSWALCQ